MTHLGLSPADALRALQAYLRALDAAERAFLADAAPGRPPGSSVEFEDLRFSVEVDVRARSTLEGQARMSRFEAATFEPGLRALHVGLIEAGEPGLSTEVRARRLQGLRTLLEQLIARCADG